MVSKIEVQVMEQHLGRELRPCEMVRHKNGDANDNSLENLELWSSEFPSKEKADG